MTLESEMRRVADLPTEELQRQLRTLTTLDALAGGGSEADLPLRAVWAVLVERGETPCRKLNGIPQETP